MRLWLLPLLLLAGGACVFLARSQSEDPALAQAKVRLEKLRTLVDAGAAPRAELTQAEDDIADAEDAAFLRQTLDVEELTEPQTDAMIEAAGRRYQRRKQAYETLRQQVDAGVAAPESLSRAEKEIDLARKEYELAYVRAKRIRDLTAMAQAEQSLQQSLGAAPQLGERYDGDGVFSPKTFSRVESAFERRFGHALPVSAMGETAVHRALGFDHRGRVDVALSPDQPEGVWLREYLAENHIPYFAFRQAVPGKATGAHIHIGPQSTRLAHGG